MFFKKKPDIELNAELLKKNKIPILVKDPTWKTMATHFNDRKVNGLSQELIQLLKEEKQVEIEINHTKKQKSTLTQQILEMSHQLNQDHQKHSDEEMPRAKSALQETTSKLETLYQRRDEMPFLIQEANVKLLNATVDNAADQLVKEDQEHQKLEKEINQLRKELNRLREKKETAEEKMQLYYQFLHSLLGPEQMEKLDQQVQYKQDS